MVLIRSSSSYEREILLIARNTSIAWVPSHLLPSIKGWFRIRPKPRRAAFSSTVGYKSLPAKVYNGVLIAESRSPSSRMPSQPPDSAIKAAWSIKTWRLDNTFIWQVPHKHAYCAASACWMLRGHHRPMRPAWNRPD